MTRLSTAVVIPTWNRADRVGAAIESVLAQLPPPAELVVVDDGSTDDTGSVLERFGDRIRVESRSNAGPSAARNTGIARSTASVVAFVDSDDRLLPEALAAALAELEAGADAAIWSARDSSDGSIMTKPSPGADYSLDGLIGPDEGFASGCGAFRRTLLERVGGFDTGLRVGEDYLLLLSALASGGAVRIVRQPGYLRERDSTARLSASVVGNMRGKLAALARFVEAYPEAAEARRDRIRTLRARYLFRLGRALAEQPGETEAAKRSLAEACRLNRWRIDYPAAWLGVSLFPAGYRALRNLRR